MGKEISYLMTEFLGHVFQHKSIVVGAIKNVMLRRILLVLVFPGPQGSMLRKTRLESEKERDGTGTWP